VQFLWRLEILIGIEICISICCQKVALNVSSYETFIGGLKLPL